MTGDEPRGSRGPREVTGEQLGAARALVRMKQAELSVRSGVSIDNVKRLEASVGPVRAFRETYEAVVQVLEAAGVEFVPDARGKGAGVRLRNAARPGSVTEP